MKLGMPEAILVRWPAPFSRGTPARKPEERDILHGSLPFGVDRNLRRGSWVGPGRGLSPRGSGGPRGVGPRGPIIQSEPSLLREFGQGAFVGPGETRSNFVQLPMYDSSRLKPPGPAIMEALRRP
ncbi:hypothetical protein KM043_000810 [Ampulex compressa]|nr:hypothetical protein KM043_000810 [Ampulex compressa]